MTEPMVVILAAYCEECGRYGSGLTEPGTLHDATPGWAPYPWPQIVPASELRQPWSCSCGGRMVFALTGVSDD